MAENKEEKKEETQGGKNPTEKNKPEQTRTERIDDDKITVLTEKSEDTEKVNQPPVVLQLHKPSEEDVKIPEDSKSPETLQEQSEEQPFRQAETGEKIIPEDTAPPEQPENKITDIPDTSAPIFPTDEYDFSSLLVQPIVPIFRRSTADIRNISSDEDFSTLSFLKLKAPDFTAWQDNQETNDDEPQIDISAQLTADGKKTAEPSETVTPNPTKTTPSKKTSAKKKKKKKKKSKGKFKSGVNRAKSYVTGIFVRDKKNTVGKKKKHSQKGMKALYPKVVGGLIASSVVILGAFIYMYNFNQAVVPTAASVNIPGGKISAPQTDPVFLKGIQVEGFDLSGKTLSEAKSLLAVRGGSLLPKVTMSVVYEGLEYRYTNEDMNFSHNMNSVVERAYEYSNYVIAEGSKDIMAYIPDDGNIEINEENNTLNFRVEYKVTPESVRKIVKRVDKKVDIPCIEPHVSRYDPSQEKNAERYTFVEGKAGKVIDQETLVNQAMEQFNVGVSSVMVTAVGHEKQPELQMADVRQAVRLIGKYSTITNNTYNANVNMALALEAVNGTVIEPGEIFSFNNCTGNSNLSSNGYLPAGVIAQGTMATGIGGGICQSATTIYNAGIMANMEIVERKPHLWCSLYCYGGLDATIDWGNIDLKMKNTSKYQMFFRCWMDGDVLNAEIYGWQSPEFDEVRTESEVDWSSYDAYGYNAYRVFYLNGKQVKKEELPYSVYSMDGSGIREGDYGAVSTKLTQPE